MKAEAVPEPAQSSQRDLNSTGQPLKITRSCQAIMYEQCVCVPSTKTILHKNDNASSASMTRSHLVAGVWLAQGGHARPHGSRAQVDLALQRNLRD